ncbi:hypothetical protein M422DRAFT_266058 [Sphaerobolus stellatus SS14]|uniref:Uncharacterized protein n=1 Tax=Sphaerobolus stellatus (strain SS14) TaxID=990650 RepID=A0A0C9UBT5_SPHS4|nr:hypothetical protein M422DRAFT_266058 [Sphaerobolus stellatus SS14]
MTLSEATPATGESDVKPQAQLEQHATVKDTQNQRVASKDADADDDSEDEYIPRGPKTQNIVRVDDKKKGGR